MSGRQVMWNHDGRLRSRLRLSRIMSSRSVRLMGSRRKRRIRPRNFVVDNPVAAPNSVPVLIVIVAVRTRFPLLPFRTSLMQQMRIQSRRGDKMQRRRSMHALGSAADLVRLTMRERWRWRCRSRWRWRWRRRGGDRMWLEIGVDVLLVVVGLVCSDRGCCC